MSWHAIMNGDEALRAVESTEAPANSRPLSNYARIPPGGMAGRELRVVEGALAWVNFDSTAAWAAVRAKRDALLAATDWVSVRAFELGQTVPEAWATYRQALRDITEQTDPFCISWPALPV